MNVRQVYGLIGTMALFAVCVTAFAQDGPPPQRDHDGPPPRGRGEGPGMGEGPMGRRMGPRMEPLIMRPDVQKELKLSDEQIEKIRALMPRPPMPGDERMDGPGRMGGPGSQGSEPRVRQQGGGAPGGGPEARMAPRMHDGMGPDRIDDQLSEVLSDNQMKRLKELRMQRQGAMALGRRDVAEKVGLSDEERQRIRGMIEEAMEPSREMQDGPPDRKAMEAKHAQLNEDILKSLSGKARSKWQALCGKPFKFDENWHPRRPEGGRGGGEGPPPPLPEDDGGN